MKTKSGVDWREVVEEPDERLAVRELLNELGIETDNIRQALDELRNSGLISDEEYNEVKMKIERK